MLMIDGMEEDTVFHYRVSLVMGRKRKDKRIIRIHPVSEEDDGELPGGVAAYHLPRVPSVHERHWRQRATRLVPPFI